MPDGGALTLQAERLPSGQEISCVTCGPIISGEWACLTVRDSGPGIPAQALPRIFDPFFTTKPPGQGTGLGLAQVYGIVKQHGGHIAVHTEAGRGAAFSLYFPLLAEADSEEEPAQHAALQPGRMETILVVEDDPSVSAVLIDAIQMLNYNVVHARDGHQALEYLEQHPGEIRLVLSDVIMPEMGGIALFQAIQQRGLQAPVILITGHPMQNELEQLQSEGLVGWLLKPVSLKQLIEAISSVVNPS
jgi:CheY-like chemotaxis protein